MTVHRAGGILIKDRKVLLCKSNDRDIFIPPGGRIEEGETPEKALIRELKEELGIAVTESDLEKIGTFTRPASRQEPYDVVMENYHVLAWSGEIKPQMEIEKLIWIDSTGNGIELGSSFEDDILPKLKALNLIN